MLLDSYLFMAVSSKTTTRTLCFWSVYIVIFVDKFVLVSDEFRRGNPTTKIVHVDCPILQQPSSYANYIPLLLAMPSRTRPETSQQQQQQHLHVPEDVVDGPGDVGVRKQKKRHAF